MRNMLLLIGVGIAFFIIIVGYIWAFITPIKSENHLLKKLTGTSVIAGLVILAFIAMSTFFP